MSFRLIDIENWERKEFYEHFINEVVCTYSAVVNVDITHLKEQKLYPAMIWLLTKTVNDMPEFRTSLTPEGLGIYDDMHPMYTVFNKENKNFSGIWSWFSEDYGEFLKSYEADAAEYSKSTRYAPKDGTPSNSFNISMVPWLEFTGSTSMSSTRASSSCRSSPWASSSSGTVSGFCPWPSRCITLSVMDTIWVSSWRSCRGMLMHSNKKGAPFGTQKKNP